MQQGHLCYATGQFITIALDAQILGKIREFWRSRPGFGKSFRKGGRKEKARARSKEKVFKALVELGCRNYQGISILSREGVIMH